MSTLTPEPQPNNSHPTEYDPTIQVEADDSAGTSDYGSSASSATQSVTSVRDYVYSNGRRYHSYGGEGKYVLPNDEAEQDRLDLAHHAYTLILGGELHTAKLERVHQVLDCGTGTGIWALDFGAAHPEAVVTGVDLSPIQPSWVYPNVKFEIDDLEKPWTWDEDHFDFIHSREVKLGIRDFPNYVRQMYRHVKPGGVVEISEPQYELFSQDGTYTPDTALYQWFDAFCSSGKKAGFNFSDGDGIVEIMREAGFVDVVKRTYMAPWGPWPKKKNLKHLGHVIAAITEGGLEAYGLHLLTTLGGFTKEDAQALCHDAMKDIMGLKVRIPIFPPDFCTETDVC